MVNALVAILEMVTECVRDVGSSVRVRKDDKMMALSEKATHLGNEASVELKNACGVLVSEATRSRSEGSVAPTVTPEAILIKVLGRLTQGVFGTGSVDVIKILEHCLDQLVGASTGNLFGGAY